MSDDYAMRRVPVQERSQQKVEAILDTAARLFAEVGYGSATTNAIARRAGVGIATLYRFFPHKAAILKAVSDRYLAQIEQLNQALFAAQRIQTLSLSALMEQVVDAFAEFCLNEPGFEYLFYGTEARDYFRAVSLQIHLEIVMQVEKVLERHVSHFQPDERGIVANLTVAAMQATMPFVIASPSAQQRALLAHLKLMLTTYLQTIAANTAQAS
jgi:AcrR family transcriptional regulator